MRDELKSNDVTLRELIHLQFEGLRAEMRSNNEMLQKDVQFIKEQTAKTNGRVTKLEDEFTSIKSTQDKCPIQHLTKDVAGVEKEQKDLTDWLQPVKTLVQRPVLLKIVLIGLLSISLTSLLSVALMVLKIKF